MSKIVKIVTGKDQIVTVQLLKKGVGDEEPQPFEIDTGATVRAVLVTADHKTKLGDEIACLHTTAGADWANSLVAIAFSGSDTGQFTYTGRALIEIEVEEVGVDSPFFPQVLIVKGHLT